MILDSEPCIIVNNVYVSVIIVSRSKLTGYRSGASISSQT